jgi:hypothetical protein
MIIFKMTEPLYKQIDINSEISCDEIQEYDPEYYWYNVTDNEYLGKYKNSRKFSKSNGEESYHQFENGLAGGCSWVLIGSDYSETLPNIIKRVINNRKLVELKEKAIVARKIADEARKTMEETEQVARLVEAELLEIKMYIDSK